jgi:hypothetical protein
MRHLRATNRIWTAVLVALITGSTTAAVTAVVHLPGRLNRRGNRLDATGCRDHDSPLQPVGARSGGRQRRNSAANVGWATKRAVGRSHVPAPKPLVSQRDP